MAIATINPATGETVKTFEALSDQEVEAALDRAVGDYRTYRRSGFAERAGLLEEIARRLDGRSEELAATITTEMGKTLESARFEVGKSADIFRWFAPNAEHHLADEPVDAAAVGAEQAFLRYAPLGPVLGVMPWNFPLYQVTRFLAPQLMIGNVALVKHASNVPQSALLIVDIVHDAGVPAGVYQNLLLEASAVERVERDRRIRGASVTGSVGAGTAVGRVAGEEIKKSVQELGGSDPFIVLPSADVEAAVRVGVVARCHNNGQSCVAAEQERFLRDLEAGMLTVNGATTTYPELTFGGVKRSGYGRELGVPGLREFCNVQSVRIGRTGPAPIARSE